MSLTKRLLAVLLTMAMLGAAALSAVGSLKTEDLQGEVSVVVNAKETLYFWYTDEALGDFLNSVALEYYEETGYRIVPVHHFGLEYLEAINAASIRTEEVPDLFITTNDMLEKASLAGLAVPVADAGNVCNASYFSKAALDAVNYKGKLLGYPFYYETSVFLYNKTYMENLAKTLLEAEADQQLAQEAEAVLNNAEDTQAAIEAINDMEAAEFSEAELTDAAEEKIGEIIPSSIDDILNFADEYDAPEEVEAVFKWDVSDIFYNYFFIGQAMTVGGDAGDNPEKIDINNQEARDCLTVYQNLNQFFSIDAKEVSYDSILQEFIDGKIVFTVVTTDAIGKVEEAKEAGNFAYEYGVAVLPDISETLPSRSLSVTNAVVVNGYSAHKEIADDFARFLTVDRVDSLYLRCGKIASLNKTDYENENIKACMEEYANSIPMPKMLETSNFWVQLEICFTRIWDGDAIEAVLSDLENQIAIQINGSEQAALASGNQAAAAEKGE